MGNFIQYISASHYVTSFYNQPKKKSYYKGKRAEMLHIYWRNLKEATAAKTYGIYHKDCFKYTNLLEN
jgi:hypothetical protein